MLQQFSVNARDRTALAFAAVGALLLVPIHVVAREGKAWDSTRWDVGVWDGESSRAPIVVAKVPLPPTAPEPVPELPPLPPAPSAIPDVPSIPPVPPEPPALLSSNGFGQEGHAGNQHSHDPYIYVNGDSNTMSASINWRSTSAMIISVAALLPA